MRCDYLFGFQVERRKNKSLLLQNWLKNTSFTKEDEYKTPIFAYNIELDSLILTSYILRSPEEEETSPPHIKDAVTDLEKDLDNILPHSKDMEGRKT
jgi:hypothetical protein